MNKYYMLFLSSVLMLSTISNAAVYKGQKVFVKKCLKCHETGQNFVASKNQDEWDRLLKSDGKQLASIHIKDENATESWKYFTSKKFTKKSKHLKDFLVEYAKDSGNAPACD